MRMSGPRFRALIPPLAGILLAGCGVSKTPTSTPAVTQGVIQGGQQPVAGATVQLYAVGTTGDGSAAMPLLSPAQTTNAQGEFNLYGLYTCPTPTSLIYLVGTGGNPGLGTGGSNPQLALMAALGQCQNLTSSSYVNVNELTTVAAAYALAPYLTSPSAIGSGTSDATALAAAFSYAQELVNTSTGTTPGTGLPSGMTVPTGQIDTIADILANCINSSGGTATTTICGSLFEYTTPLGGASPPDPITALANLSLNPTLNTSFLYPMALPTAPYQPTDPVQPPDLSIALIAASTMALTPTAGLTFPSTGLGSTSSSLTATLTNNGPGTIAVYSIAISGANASEFAETTNCPSSMTASTSCSIGVAFTPTVQYTQSATLSISTEATNSPLSIPLSGFGAIPTISLSTSSLTFAPSTVGSPSTAQPVVFTNSGPGTLTLGTISITGINASDFSQTNNCPGTLAVSAYCTVTLNVTPSTVGTRSATLSIASNGSPSPSTVSLTGTGTAPPTGTLVASTPALFVGGGDNGYFDLTNTASTAVSISAIAISPNYFTQTNNCGTSLASGASCLVTVQLSASNAATGIATLTVTNSSSQPNVSVTLLGGYYSNINFGTAEIGAAGNIQAVSAQPEGSGGYGENATLSGTNAEDFSFDGPSNCFSRYYDCSVEVLFTPSAVGARVALLNNGWYNYNAVGFGVAAGNMQTVTATGNGLFPQTALGASSPAQAVTVSNPLGHLLNFIPSTNPDYTVSPSTCSTTTCTMYVTFTPITPPATSSPSSGAVLIFDSATNLTTTFYTSGYGGIPKLSFTPAQLNFGSVNLGSSSASETFSVTNTGDSPGYVGFGLPMNGSYATFEFLGASTYATLTGTTPYTMPGYVFTPAGTGTRSATVTFTDPRTGLLLGTYQLTGTGTGTTTVTLGANPASLSFFSAVGVASPSQQVTVTNSGNSIATLGTISFSGANASDFAETTTCGATLLASASCSVTVTFTPGALGSRIANLLVPSNDPNSPLTIALSGNTRPYLSAAPATFYVPNFTQPVTLNNPLSSTLTISAISTNSANWAELDNCGTSLAAYASCTIYITSSSSTGVFSGTLTVTDSDPSSPQTVALTTNAPYTNFGGEDFITQPIPVGQGTTVGMLLYGSATSNLDTVSFSGPNAGALGFGASCYAKVVGGGCVAYFTFGASVPGLNVLYYTASSGSTGYITGWGLANDVYIVAAPGLPAMDAYSFGSQTRGTTASQTFAIYNVTSYTQTYTFSNTTGTLNSGDFTIDSSNCASSLVADSNESTFAPPDNYCSVTVTFKPTTTGFRSTALTITDSHGDQAVIPIVGKGQ